MGIWKWAFDKLRRDKVGMRKSEKQKVRIWKWAFDKLRRDKVGNKRRRKVKDKGERTKVKGGKDRRWEGERVRG